MNQDEIFKIVKTWKIKKNPEYREFRCAKCQRKIRKAWHIWVNKGSFKLEIHFCKKCFKQINKKREL
ncbi:hypothetical protein AMJ49_00760 [Parcubacteria bacterium DG_74_2]|nr:MAG: hypothetical protein AMJ49_00760 [Parcubacteria bacterium DG_74_2]